MFNRTRIQLVALNSIVFFLLVNCFGGVLYFATHQWLYSQVDDSLHRDMAITERVMNRFPEREFGIRPPRLTSYVMWDRQGQVVRQFPSDAFADADLAILHSAVGQGKPRTVAIGNDDYRVASREAPGGGGYLLIAYNLEPQGKVLNNLLVIMGIAGVGSIAIAILAAYFLVGRSFVPIRKAWEQQQQFVSDASHELRTPLSVLQINLERLFRHPERTVEEQSRNISVMLDETKRMSKLVSELLTLARSDSDKVIADRTRLDLQELVKKVGQKFSDLAAAKQLELIVLAEEPIEIWGDEERLHQLLGILLDNAIKYTRQGGITVACSRQGTQARITVADTGIGISEEDLPRIFDRFYRADKVRSRSEGGTGLGLAIAKSIAEAHRGSITATSTLQEGTVFHVHLPTV
jgi:two-component system, OmpR family, sensor histidine kinase CiaH